MNVLSVLDLCMVTFWMYQHPTDWFLFVLSLKGILEQSISLILQDSMRLGIPFVITVAFSVLVEKSPKQITQLFSLKFDDSTPI